MIARLEVKTTGLVEYPIATRARDGWQNGATYYPDYDVTKVTPLIVHAASLSDDLPAEAPDPHGRGMVCSACGVPFHLIQHNEGCDERKAAGPAGSGHTRSDVGQATHVSGGSAEEPSTHLIPGPAANAEWEGISDSCPAWFHGQQWCACGSAKPLDRESLWDALYPFVPEGHKEAALDALEAKIGTQR